MLYKNYIYLTVVFFCLALLPKPGYSQDLSLLMKEKAIKEARDSFKEKDYAVAEIKSRGVINKYPRFYPAYNLLGSIYTATDNIEPAIVCLERSVRINPRQHGIYDKLSYLYNRSSDPSRAVIALEKSLEYFPGDSDKLYKIGLIYFVQKKDTQKALEYFLQSKENGNDDVAVLYFIGASYLLEGQKILTLEYISHLRSKGEQFLSTVLEDFIKRSSSGKKITVDDFNALFSRSQIHPD